VLANGGRGAGSSKINYGPYGGHAPFNGWESWETWGGTSRSAPVAGGNLALVYQAYHDRHGRWPTYQQAKDFLIAGADDAKADPSLQGGGVLNADRATDLAAGIYGVYATPSGWNVGDYRGTDYESFAHLVSPGDVVVKSFTVHNPSGHSIDVDLSDGILTQIGSAVQIPWTSKHLDLESGFNFHSPDYLIPITATLIPPETDLMVVRFVQPLDQYDPDADYTTENHWRHLVYNWTDLNGDGMVWEDRDGNGVVNHVDDVAAGLDNDGVFRLDFADPATEMQQGEYIRLDYNFLGNTDQFTIRDPLDRMDDGLFVGLQHRTSTPDLPVSGLTIYLEFYQRVDWPWLGLSDTSLTVPPWDAAAFDATMTVPGDADYGFYDGCILIEDSGDAHHDAHTTLLPIAVNVAAELGSTEVIFGGGSATNRMYDNNVVRGLGSWDQGGWSILGDWRHFLVDVPSSVTGGNNRLLVHTAWDDVVPTDIDTYILSPTADGFSPDPIFGPYTLDVAGTSQLDDRGGGVWAFSTWTGETEDWAIAPLHDDGLYEIGLHNGLFAGEKPEVPFAAHVGVLSMDADLGDTPGQMAYGSIAPTVYTETGTIDVWFTSTLALPDLNVDLSGGLTTDNSGQIPITVTQSSPIETFSPWLDHVVTDTFSLNDPGTTYLEVYLDCPTGTDDPDLFLIYDTNDDGQFTLADGVFAYDGGGSGGGCSELIEVSNPPLGDYAIFVDGYAIGAETPGVSNMPTYWEYLWVHPGPLPVDAVEIYSDTITVGQDYPPDYATASFSTTVTMDNRIAALYATLTPVSPTVDIDLYVTDDTDTVIAMSQDEATAAEAVAITPPDGGYRFEEGAEYTVWVHGYDVPTPPAAVHLNITWDVHNIWLSSTHGDVHAANGGIAAGEGVSVTVHFDKPGWDTGDPDISARLTAGPDGFATAFDSLVIFHRDDPPGPPIWNPYSLEVDYTVESARGPSPVSLWDPPVSTALAQGGEVVTWTLTLVNNDPLTVTLNTLAEVDNWGQNFFFGAPYYVQTFGSIVVTPTLGTCVYDGSWLWVDWFVTLPPGASATCAWTATTDPLMQIGDDHFSLVWEAIEFGWSSIAAADVYYRSFRAGGHKVSTPGVVEPGETFTYTVSLENPSAEDGYVYFSDPLPDEVTFVSATGGATYSAGTHTVSWGGSAPGSTVSTLDFDIVVNALPGLADGVVIENVASLAEKYEGTPFTYFDAETLVDDGVSPSLVVEKDVDAFVSSIGYVLDYTIVFRNTGTEAATGVLMSDVVPAQLEVLTGTVAASKASTSIYDLYEDGLIRWEGDLAVSEVVTVTFQATISEAAWPELALINAAEVTADNWAGEAYSSALTEVLEFLKFFLPLVMTDG
jgi:uncharacterized repeat protein (TIGR01451 family)